MTAKVFDAVRSFPNGDGVAADKYLRVENNSGNVALGDQSEELGILETTLLAGDEMASVRFLQPGVTVRMVAAQAISAYADVYRAAGGKITDAQFGSEDRIGIALEAATGDGSIIEVLPTPGGAPTTSEGTTTTTAAP